MNYFNAIKQMNIDEMAEFLEQYTKEIIQETKKQLIMTKSVNVSTRNDFKLFLLTDTKGELND